MDFKSKRGISLLTLVTTICVTLLLSAIVINTAMNLDMANRAAESKFKSDLKNYDEEIKLAIGKEYMRDRSILNKTIVNLDEISKYSLNLVNSEYKELVFISEGELTLYGDKLTEEQRQWATEANIKISDIIQSSENVLITANPADWTNGEVVVKLTYIDIPAGYVFQYKFLGDEAWNDGDKVVISENVTLVARLWNERIRRSKRLYYA